MIPLAREWVEKAEADFAAALILRRSRKKHSRDIVCFHLQKAVEKDLKARLAEAASTIPKTHDLEKLLDLLIPLEPLWATLRPALAAITNYAVEVRYPGRTVTVAEARVLLKDTNHIRQVVRRSLGLP